MKTHLKEIQRPAWWYTAARGTVCRNQITDLQSPSPTAWTLLSSEPSVRVTPGVRSSGQSKPCFFPEWCWEVGGMSRNKAELSEHQQCHLWCLASLKHAHNNRRGPSTQDLAEHLLRQLWRLKSLGSSSGTPYPTNLATQLFFRLLTTCSSQFSP